MGNEADVEEGQRYRIVIDSVKFYVWMSDVSVSVSYAYENREESIKTRTVLEKFCAELSRIMKERKNVSETEQHAGSTGECKRIEGQEATDQEVCG